MVVSAPSGASTAPVMLNVFQQVAMVEASRHVLPARSARPC